MTRQQSEESSGLPRWAVLTILGILVVVALGVGAWLMMGGMAKVMRMMPEGVLKTVGEAPGEGKRVQQKLTDYPGEKAGQAAEEAGGGEAVDPEKLLGYLAPLTEQAQQVDDAIAKMRAGKAGDQALLNGADQAFAALRNYVPRDVPKAYLPSLEEKKRALVSEKRTVLDAAKRAARATHLVAGTDGTARLELRKAADPKSESVAGIEDGTLVQVHLDTGKGWSRVDILSGPSTGKAGYLQNEALKKIVVDNAK